LIATTTRVNFQVYDYDLPLISRAVSNKSKPSCRWASDHRAAFESLHSADLSNGGDFLFGAWYDLQNLINPDWESILAAVRALHGLCR